MFLKGKRTTYKDFNRRVNRLAHALLEIGLKRRDKIASLLYNCSEAVEVYFAAAKIGIVTVPINYRLVEREVHYIVQQSESSVVIYITEFKKALKNIAAEENLKLTSVRKNSLAGSLDYEKLLSCSCDEETNITIKEDALRLIMYTSGTTGLPKGAMFSHKNNL